MIGLTYFQWYFALPVFMRDVHSFPPEFYGSLMGFAGVLVILFQLPITRRTKIYGPLVLMAVGSLLFALGFGMFAFISALGLFVVAFAIITVGEMIFFPTQQAIVARLAPEDMRGRYLAAAGLAFSLPNIVGPSLGGFLLDRANPNLLWYLGSLLCVVGVVAYLVLRAPFKIEAASTVEG
ncbi:MAG: MFS transporter [Planctomycetota bacterium]|jgi:MFS family permease